MVVSALLNTCCAMDASFYGFRALQKTMSSHDQENPSPLPASTRPSPRTYTLTKIPQLVKLNTPRRVKKATFRVRGDHNNEPFQGSVCTKDQFQKGELQFQDAHNSELAGEIQFKPADPTEYYLALVSDIPTTVYVDIRTERFPATRPKTPKPKPADKVSSDTSATASEVWGWRLLLLAGGIAAAVLLHKSSTSSATPSLLSQIRQVAREARVK